MARLRQKISLGQQKSFPRRELHTLQCKNCTKFFCYGKTCQVIDDKHEKSQEMKKQNDKANKTKQ